MQFLLYLSHPKQKYDVRLDILAKKTWTDGQTDWGYNFMSSCQRKNVQSFLEINLTFYSMGIEHHNQPETLSRMVEFSNLVFSFIFTIEMFMKIAAFGLIQYISDGFNVFDGFLVCFGYNIKFYCC